MAEIYLPVANPIADPKSGMPTSPMVGWMRQVTREIPSEGGAPADAEYLLGALDADLPNGRQAIDSSTIDVDLSTPGQVSWSVIASAQPIIKGATLTLTDTQIKALPSGEFTIVAAQGTGTRIVPLFVDLVIDTSGGAYANIDSNAFWYCPIHGETTATNAITNDATLPRTFLTTWLTGTTIKQVTLVPYTTAEPVDDWGNLAVPVTLTATRGRNVPWVLSVSNGAAGNYTGGNAANSLTITPWYGLVNY